MLNGVGSHQRILISPLDLLSSTWLRYRKQTVGGAEGAAIRPAKRLALHPGRDGPGRSPVAGLGQEQWRREVGRAENRF